MNAAILEVFIHQLFIDSGAVHLSGWIYHRTEIVPESWLPGLEEVIRTTVIDVAECSGTSPLQSDLSLIGLFAPAERLVTRHGDVGGEEAEAWWGGDDILPHLYGGGVSKYRSQTVKHRSLLSTWQWTFCTKTSLQFYLDDQEIKLVFSL